jgi:hypothetical protein
VEYSLELIVLLTCNANFFALLFCLHHSIKIYLCLSYLWPYRPDIQLYSCDISFVIDSQRCNCKPIASQVTEFNCRNQWGPLATGYNFKYFFITSTFSTTFLQNTDSINRGTCAYTKKGSRRVSTVFVVLAIDNRASFRSLNT